MPIVQKPWLKKSSLLSSQNKPKPTSKPSSTFKWAPQRSSKPHNLPANFEVDKDARYVGTVTSYRKWSGFGFIEPSTTGVVPNDELYVHWSNIQTDDRYPFLIEGMQVEFGLMKWKENGITTVNAKTVTLPGGGTIALQDDLDAQKKTFVGGQNLRYTGLLQYYNPARGHGWVTLDDGYALEHPVPKELKVEDFEVNCAGKKLHMFLKDLQVEFGIVQNKAGAYRVYNMTLPGGVPLLQENLENRQELGSKIYECTIATWNWRQCWGFIEPDESVILPSLAKQQLKESAAAGQKDKQTWIYFRKPDIVKGIKASKGLAVMFQLYIDDKGVGAFNIHE